MTADRYREAGVDLDAGARATTKIAKLVASTRTELSRGIVGGFGGMVRVPQDVRDPILVTSTDSVGTKVLVAARAERLAVPQTWRVDQGVVPRDRYAALRASRRDEILLRTAVGGLLA